MSKPASLAMIISNKVRKEASMNCVSILRGLVVASFISTTFGCASIVSDSVYPVEITSTPSGANFEIKNQAGQVVQTGSTPGYARLEAGAGYFDGEFFIPCFVCADESAMVENRYTVTITNKITIKNNCLDFDFTK